MDKGERDYSLVWQTSEGFAPASKRSLTVYDLAKSPIMSHLLIVPIYRGNDISVSELPKRHPVEMMIVPIVAQCNGVPTGLLELTDRPFDNRCLAIEGIFKRDAMWRGVKLARVAIITIRSLKKAITDWLNIGGSVGVSNQEAPSNSSKYRQSSIVQFIQFPVLGF